jgi:glycosyltransferase involved in cell wall biosynthesis
VPRLLYEGRLVAYKVVELLLRAEAMARQSSQFELQIVGGGNASYQKYCQDLANELGLRDITQFINPMPRYSLVELYQSADVFCLPSAETYGIAILEAMSCGRAVLVSDINGPGDIVQRGTGVKVPLHDPDQFLAEYAKRIVELVENPSLRIELGAAARDHVVQHHDWRNIQARYLEIYDEFLGPRTPLRATVPKTIVTVSL